MLVVAVISVDAYSFWALSDLIWQPQDQVQMQVFSGCTVLCNSKQIEHRSSDQEVSASAGENTKVVLVPCGTWNCVSTAISGGFKVSEVHWCHLF